MTVCLSPSSISDHQVRPCGGQGQSGTQQHFRRQENNQRGKDIFLCENFTAINCQYSCLLVKKVDTLICVDVILDMATIRDEKMEHYPHYAWHALRNINYNNGKKEGPFLIYFNFFNNKYPLNVMNR